MSQTSQTSSLKSDHIASSESKSLENTTPLVEIESEGSTTSPEGVHTDALGAISTKPLMSAPPIAAPLPTLKEVDTDQEEYIIQGKILSRLGVQLRSIRVIFLIVATLYLSARMLVISGIAPLDLARWVHNLEPALFFVTMTYIAIWCAFVCVGASLRFAFTRYVFFALTLISTVLFGLWWSNMSFFF